MTVLCWPVTPTSPPAGPHIHAATAASTCSKCFAGQISIYYVQGRRPARATGSRRLASNIAASHRPELPCILTVTSFASPACRWPGGSAAALEDQCLDHGPPFVRDLVRPGVQRYWPGHHVDRA